MKLSAIGLFIMISGVAFGQDYLPLQGLTNSKRLLLGLNISPDYCSHSIKSNDGSTSTSSIIELKKKFEGPKLGYTAGLNLSYLVAKRISIEVGAQYSNKGYEKKKSELFFGDVIDPRYGFTYTSYNSTDNMPTTVQIKYNHIYLDVPVRAIFSVGEKRIRFLTSIGVTTNVFLKATRTIIIEYENGESKRQTGEQQHDYRSFNISPTISVGVDYNLSKRINIRAEPTFRYGLLKIMDAPIATYLWSGGMNISCYYSLK